MAEDITSLLRDWREGDLGARDRLVAVLYPELRALADRQLRGERANHTLQPTALVHEAFLRLVEGEGPEWEGRRHFLAVAARAMRRVLVDHARSRNAAKRGGGAARLPLDDALMLYEDRATDLLALDEALDRLDGLDNQLGRIVELRFFGGLTNREAGEVLGLSTRSVERGWSTARAWLRGALSA